MRERSALVDAIRDMAIAFSEAAPEAFKVFWYDKGGKL
jgi:hypothetical protein